MILLLKTPTEILMKLSQLIGKLIIITSLSCILLHKGKIFSLLFRFQEKQWPVFNITEIIIIAAAGIAFLDSSIGIEISNHITDIKVATVYHLKINTFIVVINGSIAMHIIKINNSFRLVSFEGARNSIHARKFDQFCRQNQPLRI